ncbi:hypothetical protein BDV95DRAFT_586257 [Massariosphaeria phaeospora]|uniref:Uncharacterized protein n=1 Tax=Massariosphaeria phaeospora TaxID=100035 RepID=A0A7C8M2J6_9PLEO|nr:hypothetical protein BDV95DRAFT_586257 [Massariosphaeria phaeospora]
MYEEMDEHEDLDIVRHISTLDSTHRSSNSSKLFFSDPDDNIHPMLVSPSSSFAFFSPPLPELTAETNVKEADMEDVPEEIMDAIALFSRRCNRDKEPLRLRLAAEVLEDDEVADALKEALRLGLGQMVELADGSQRWTIGPRSG